MADTPDYREWQVPPAAEKSKIVGWVNEATQEGQAWLRSQRGFSDMRKALDIISGLDSGRRTAEYRSHVTTNRLKRNIDEITYTLAKLRPAWGYHSDNVAYKSSAAMFNKVTRAWYLESFADVSIREALQYAATTGRGWVRPIYRRDMGGTGHGDIKLLTYGSPCFLPVQLPASGDFQQAYCVTILDEMPVYMAHGMFPSHQHELRPSSSRYWYSSDGVRKASQGNLMQRMFGRTPRNQYSEGLSDLLVPIRYSYIIDLSINTSKQEIVMGEPGSSWSYKVPYYGQEIPMGDGSTYRKANENDARLYPYRRCIITSDIANLYDGPSFDWHGMLPGVCFQLNPYPWEPGGFSLVRGGAELQSSINEIARGNMDKVRSQLDPSLAYDTNAVGQKEAERYDPMLPRSRVGFDGSAIEGQPFHPTIDPEILKISPESMALWEKFEEVMDAQQAINDVRALAKMRAVGSMDELEKIVEANGPIVEGMSRGMEPPMRDLGVMLKYLIMQYYTSARVMQWVGADGVSKEVFDFDPASLVPSHLPGEDPDKTSPSSQITRARIFADNLRFLIMPNSLHEMSQMVMKLGLIQLKKAGVFIDSQTIAEAWAIPNWGTLEGETVIEKYKSEQEMLLEFAVRMAELKTALGGDGQAPPGAPGPGKQPEGRPSTNAAPPDLKSKDGGARSTITTSK